jgi:hypothetical protein
MRKMLGIGLVVVVALLFVPSKVAACKTCDCPGFWDPNCAHSGCTYCLACSICCGGDPGAGGHCATYCVDPVLAYTGTALSFSQSFTPVDMPSEVPGFLATMSPAEFLSVNQ